MKEMLGGCCVCADENGWAGNPLVYCDGPDCEVAVHQGCYGILEVPEGEWLCAKCAVAAAEASVAPKANGSAPGTSTNPPRPPDPPRCELCPFGYGALKRTDKKKWVHVICALYIPEVRFGDVHSMDPVILNDVPLERFDRMCYLCDEEGAIKAAKVGACMSCNRPGCKKGFHVTCAQQRGLLCEEGGVSKNVKYCGYCSHHLRKAQQDPSIKVVPPCRVRPLAPSSLTTSAFLSASSSLSASVAPKTPSASVAAASTPPATAATARLSNSSTSSSSSASSGPANRDDRKHQQNSSPLTPSTSSTSSASSSFSSSTPFIGRPPNHHPAVYSSSVPTPQLNGGSDHPPTSGPSSSSQAGMAASTVAGQLLNQGGSTTFSPPLTSSSRSSPLHHAASTVTVKEALHANGGTAAGLLHSLAAPSTSGGVSSLAMSSSASGVSTYSFSSPSTTVQSSSTKESASSAASIAASITAVANSAYNGGSLQLGSTSHPTNHNRLDLSTSSSSLPRVNGHHAAASLPANVTVGAALAAGLAATVTPKANSAKRSHKALSGGDEKGLKRPRNNNHHSSVPSLPSSALPSSLPPTRASAGATLAVPAAPKQPSSTTSASSERALRESCEQLVSETVSEFQCERADKAAAAEAAQRSRQLAATHAAASSLPPDMSTGVALSAAYARAAAGGNSLQDVKPTLATAHSSSMPSTSSANQSTSLPVPTRLSGASVEESHAPPVTSSMPGSMEELLERQWEQGSQFLISNSSFDVSELLTCLHQLKRENVRLVEQLTALSKRRDHLYALNARLAMPLGSALPSATVSSASAASIAQGLQPVIAAPQPQLPISHGAASTSMSSMMGGGGTVGHAATNGSLLSPHAANSSPHFGMQPVSSLSGVMSSSSEDSLNQLRSLAAAGGRAGTPAGARRGAEQPQMPSVSSARGSILPPSSMAAISASYHRSASTTSASSLTPVGTSPSFQPTSQSSITHTGLSSVTPTASTSGSLESSIAAAAAVANMSPERLAATLASHPLLSNSLLRNAVAASQQQQLTSSPNGMQLGEQLLASLFLQQQQQQQPSAAAAAAAAASNILNSPNAASLLRMMMGGGNAAK